MDERDKEGEAGFDCRATVDTLLPERTHVRACVKECVNGNERMNVYIYISRGRNAIMILY